MQYWMRTVSWLGLGMSMLLGVSTSQGQVIPTALRCEYLENPLGIDSVQPRLSWILKDPQHVRGQTQTAYRLLVASSATTLAADEGDLWDSGKVDSDQSVHVSYAGRQLISHQSCWWKVRVWDKDGKPSAWSQPATWSMGILQPEQWQAEWLSHTEKVGRRLPKDDPARKLTFDGCKWMWAPDPQPIDRLPAGNRFFLKRIVLPDDAVVDWAYFLLAADDRYRLYLNGKSISISRDESEAWRQGYEVDLSEKLRPGVNVFAIQAENRQPGPAGLAGKLVVRLASGEERILSIDEDWKASTQGGRNWQQPSFDDSSWPPARALVAVGAKPWSVPRVGYAPGWLQTAPSPIFRKSFSVHRPVRRATVYVTGVGYYELHLNGKKVGDSVLDPAFTRYDRRILYSTYDVTDMIRSDKNVLGVMLGNGWYNMHTRATWDYDQAPWRAEPRMRLHLRIELADGTVQTIVSDRSWQASTGPVFLDSIRTGEVYDARREQSGWDTPDFDAGDWPAATIASPPGGVLHSEMMPPLRVTQTIPPVSVRQTRPGVFLFDLGQNIAGWAQLRVSGPAGTRVVLRYSERIRPDGSLDRDEIGKFVFAGPFQQDTYILKGDGQEEWEPHFVYHGFRYVEVTGFPGQPTVDTLQGRVVHTDFKSAGRFRCADPLLNRIQTLTLWSYRSNFHGYPTDCPQREKNGWTGDAHLAAEQAMFNWHNAAAYSKWMNDIQDEQRESGEIAAIIPTSGWGYQWGNGPAWDSAYVLIPWYLYLYRGDQQILQRHYASMKRYVDYVASRSPEQIADFGLGDWVPADTQTPRDVTSTGYFHADTLIVARTAALLGHQDAAAKYTDLAAKIRDAFDRKFYHGDGRYANGSQTALSCALFQGLVEPAERSRVVAKLVEAVHAKSDHLDVGILGAKYLLNTLSDRGEHDLAYRIATQRTFPSYGYWVDQGATTLWEDWNGHSSLNHIMFGDISAWMYKYLAGIRIDPERPGFKHVIIHPLVPADLAWVEARHDSIHGPIRVRWERKEETFELTVALPPNTTGRVFVPAKSSDRVFETGRPAEESPGVRLVEAADDFRCYDAASGQYTFRVQRMKSR